MFVVCAWPSLELEYDDDTSSASVARTKLTSSMSEVSAVKTIGLPLSEN